MRDPQTNPHPNIVECLGCIVNKEGRISELGFVKYSITLSPLLKDRTPFDKERCLHGIEASINHMHNLTLIYNDLNPNNTMIAGDNMGHLIIDFDLCALEGEGLGLKGGTMDWSLETDDAARDKYLYSLSKIEEVLSEDSGRHESPA